ncbi:MAG: lysylphosphatidylglycerol synthase transmembrane domain-containing protein [Planctomycetota bacterium]
MWKKLLFAGSILLGVGLASVVYRHFDRQAFEAVRQLGTVGMSLYALTAAMTLIAPAISWTILMRAEGMKVSVWTALKANFMGFPINFMAPTIYLGSEPLKLLYVANLHAEPKRKVLATIIVAKFQEIGALLLVMVVSAAVAIWKIDFSPQQEVLIIACMVVLTALFGALLYAFLGNLKPTVRIIRCLAVFKSLRRKLARVRRRAEEMEDLVRQAFLRRRRVFLVSQGVTLLSALSILMRPWIFFFFSRERMLLGIEYLCAIYLVTNIINSLPHTPGGLGVFEVGMVGVFSLMGIGKDNAAAFSLVTRAADLLLILLGTWLIVHYGLQSVARQVVRGQKPLDVHEAGFNDESGAGGTP